MVTLPRERKNIDPKSSSSVGEACSSSFKIKRSFFNLVDTQEAKSLNRHQLKAKTKRRKRFALVNNSTNILQKWLYYNSMVCHY